MKLEELKELLENEQGKVKDLAAVNELIDKAMSVEESSEEAEEVDLSVSEETSEETSEEASEETSEASEETQDQIDLSAVMETVENLTKKVEDLEAKLAEKETELATKTQAEQEFLEKFKALSVSVKADKKPEGKHYIGMTNGIGEL